MTEIRGVIIACRSCSKHWQEGDPPQCREAAHAHERHEIHRHRSVVVLPDGVRVMAVSFDPAEPYGRDRTPDFGLYLDARWDPPWPHARVDWPDFGVPTDRQAAVDALVALKTRAALGERVEVGCLGAHGRTGTAMAVLAFLSGIAATEAVDWVRANYCPAAVETPAQAEFVASLRRRGRPPTGS